VTFHRPHTYHSLEAIKFTVKKKRKRRQNPWEIAFMASHESSLGTFLPVINFKELPMLIKEMIEKEEPTTLI